MLVRRRRPALAGVDEQSPDDVAARASAAIGRPAAGADLHDAVMNLPEGRAREGDTCL